MCESAPVLVMRQLSIEQLGLRAAMTPRRLTSGYRRSALI
jgi:hypothetical protein